MSRVVFSSISLALAGLVLAHATIGQTVELFGALPTKVVAPRDNPTSADKVALGRLLFWDPILSGQKDVACASCHHPRFGYAENLDLSIGANGHGVGSARAFAPNAPVRFVKRNSQSILNGAFNGLDASGSYRPALAPMFWDSRVASLEAQALEPIKALEEMRGDAYPEAQAIDVVVARLAANAEYRDLFARAFGTQRITADHLGKAIAAFERTLIAPNAPFDRYMRGDASAMSDAQVRGMQQFEAAGCANCHSGPMFSDFKTHVMAVPDNAKLAASDSGVAGTYAFRTPTLRNLAYTAPYMHSGTLGSLPEVVGFYRRVSGGRGGGRDDGNRNDEGRRGLARNPNVARADLDPALRQLNFRRGRQQDIVTFLGALNDPDFDRTIPTRVPSGLAVGGS